MILPMLIHKTRIPFQVTHGKTTRKSLLNNVLTWHWGKRKQMHDGLTDALGQIFRTLPAHGHTQDMRYRISLGYADSKRQKRPADLDGFAWIMKVAIDCYREIHLVVDDNCHMIREVRTVYLGKKDEEQLWFQVETIDNVDGVL